MRIALFALTGLGNAVLRSLIRCEAVPAILVTRNEKSDFPYYSEINIAEEARKAKVEVAFGREGEAAVSNGGFDLILVCTYHRILKKEVFEKAKLAINMHPALLPTYRGASPFYWVIRNGEAKTGITAHMLTQEADAGDVLVQKELKLDINETQGSLRKKLASLASDTTIEIMRNINEETLVRRTQIQDHASYYPRVTDEVREIDLNWPIDELQRHLNGLSPYPGALYQGQPLLEIDARKVLEMLSQNSGS